MKTKIAAIVAASIILTPLAFAYAEGTQAAIGITASGSAQTRVELHDQIKDNQKANHVLRQNLRSARRDSRADRRGLMASSTATSTHEVKPSTPRLLGWLFGHSDNTTLGQLKAEVTASSTASTNPVEANFFARLRTFLHL